MKKYLKLIIILLLLLVVVLGCTAIYINTNKPESIVKKHLSEINACINNNYEKNGEAEDDTIYKRTCTEGFLFIYRETRKKIDYNDLAERIKYQYPEYHDIENKELIKMVLSRYTSIAKNVTGLDLKTFEIEAPDGTKFEMQGYTTPTEKEIDKEFEKIKKVAKEK